MTFKDSSLVSIEELIRAVEFNRAFVPSDLLWALDILLSHKVFSLKDTLGHWVILIEVENLALVNGVFLSNTHWLKVGGIKVRMGNLLDLKFPDKFKVSRLYDPL